jgi:hypothetical protein
MKSKHFEVQKVAMDERTERWQVRRTWPNSDAFEDKRMGT